MSEALTRKFMARADEKLALIVSTVQGLSVRLDKLEETVNDKVVANIAQLQQSVGRLEDRVGGLEERVGGLAERVGGLAERIGGLTEGQQEIKISIRHMDRRVSIVNDSLLMVQVGYRDICGRVRALETNRKPPNSKT